MVKWKNIERFEGKYSISENAEIRNNGTNKVLKQTLGKTGYWTVVIRPYGRGKCFCLKIHKEYAKLFIPNPDNKPFINHKDGNKLNNSLENLEWVTHSENVLHAYRTGLTITLKGEQNHNSKLTEENVGFILGSKEKSKNLAIKFRVHPSTISRLRNNKQWKHILTERNNNGHF